MKHSSLLSRVEVWFFAASILFVFGLVESAQAHTKGISLSRFGLIDISLQANVVYSQFTNYSDGVDFTKVGYRDPRGLNITSFDLSLSGELFQFPAKYALFLTTTRDSTGFEEAFLLFHKLPFNLQMRVGEFRANFTKLNQLHDHEWLFEDPPLVYVKFLGEDGIHRPGIELTYTPPIETYVELSIDLMTGPFDADTTFANRTDPVTGFDIDKNKFAILPRASTFYSLSDNSDLEVGTSIGGFYNKPDPNNHDTTVIYALDWTYKWKPAERPIFPSMRWTTEFMWAHRQNPCVRHFNRAAAFANQPGTIDPGCDYGFSPVGDNPGVDRFLKSTDTVGGFYSELGYRFAYHWEVGGRIDYMGIPKGNEDYNSRYTVNIRYFMNPVAKLNFQYEFNSRSGDSKPYSAFFTQMNIGLGTVTSGLGKFYNLF